MKNKTNISPEELGELVASLKSLSLDEKQQIMSSLPYMNVAAIEDLYKKLVDYKKLENQSDSEIDQINLKYILLAEKELETLDINNPPNKE